MKIDAVENKNLLTWLLDHTDPDRMLIRIGAGKVLPITPQIISMVLGLPIRGENFKQYSWKEGIIFRQQLISDLNQSLTEDCDIHISNLQQEILKGNVNPLMKRCFFMILCNRLLLPSSRKWINCKSGTIVTDLQKLDTEQQLYVFTYSCSEHLYPILEQQ